MKALHEAKASEAIRERQAAYARRMTSHFATVRSVASGAKVMDRFTPFFPELRTN